ncbi:MAG: peptidoglycan DD-metalloendopeptidase family protein [Ruminococcus sp.]|nr:peptidoglycan DD-metalloendopeptidase family protein [Ruminococcus sp.]
MIKRILSLLIAIVIVFGAVTFTSADTISDLKDEQARLEQEAAEYEALMKEKEGEIEKQEEYIAALTGKIENINSQIALNREKIAAFETEISEKEDEKEALYKQAEDNLNQLKKRLRAVYMAGDASTLEIILGAGSFSDFIDKVQLVESMAEYDAKLIDEIEDQLDGINEVVDSLKVDMEEFEAEKAKLQANQDELNALLEENKEALATLYGEKQDLDHLITETEDHRYEISQEIEAYYEELRKQEEEKNQQQGGSSIPDTPVYSGNYVWPAPGQYTLTSQYYEERTGYYHGGIDIAGPNFMGTTIVASASGTVIDSCNSCTHNWGKYGSCGCGGGFGNYVWIDHGDGKATIYAHLSYHTIYTGQYVSAGEIIGYGGSTGYSTGPHLHFECRYYGTRYDPMTELN